MQITLKKEINLVINIVIFLIKKIIRTNEEVLPDCWIENQYTKANFLFIHQPHVNINRTIYTT